MGLRSLAAALVIASFVGCSDEECDLDQQTRDLARAGLNDCGISDGSAASAAEECAIDWYEQDKLFRVIRETSDGLEAFVHGGGGTYYLVRQAQSGDPIEQATCAGAIVSGGRIECDQPGDFETVCQ